MSDTVLKGKLEYQEGSDIEYIWHSSDGACEKCQALNGKKYGSIDEIPDLPHPNCKCWVEDRKKDDERCDCWEFFDELEEIISDAYGLSEEAEVEQQDANNFINELNEQIKKKFHDNINAIISEYNKIATFITAFKIFVSNFKELLDRQNGKFDKYYHSKANCEAAQLGYSGAEAARILSDAKERFDILAKGLMESIKIKNKNKDVILKKVIDGEDDQRANKEGRELGLQNPDASCAEMLEYKIPPHLRKLK